MLNAKYCSKLGIRREDKNEWEKRVPLVPTDILELKEKHSIETVVQPSKIHIFPDQDYRRIGARVQEDLSPADVVLAIKEIPPALLQPRKTYIFFSHVIKGQSHNMPMLKRIMDLKCQLIDYEKIVDSEGRRLIFFGKYAGLAGMIDTLWALGKRLEWENVPNPFSKIKQAYQYKTLDEAKEAISKAGDIIRHSSFVIRHLPFVCGFTGYGHVSRGAQEIYDLLPVQEISPSELNKLPVRQSFGGNKLNKLYKVVFKEEDMVELNSQSSILNSKFNLKDYYEHPEKYRSKFHKYLSYLTILVNCIYWDPRYPRLITKKYLEHHRVPLRVIGDLSCDVEGSIECTLHSTTPGDPVFVYDPIKKTATDGYKGKGIVILAIDNLPCELARESSSYFSNVLKRFIPEIMRADYSIDFEQCNLSHTIKNAMIVWKGKLTPNYKYLEKCL